MIAQEANDDTVILVRDVHKEFVLSAGGAKTLKTLLFGRSAKGIFHRHVLRGVTFEVKRGECVAIVGRNGAGKSTLLSLISRIYLPTSGSVETRGIVVPLLQLGAGFHLELTGRENIYVNSMILGIRSEEIEAKMDEIISFSELGEYIEKPVRTYSSGMIARLGFSVAMAINAEIVIIDEVLSVGDFDFQRKCEKKIDEMREKGTTILLVSHADAQVERLADRCLWLENGLMVAEGPPAEVLQAYKTGSTSILKAIQKKRIAEEQGLPKEEPVPVNVHKGKIFGVGRDRNGPSRIAPVLAELGYTIGSEKEARLLVEPWSRRNFTSLVETARAADFYEGVPFSLDFTYAALDRAYPRSKFILTVREDPGEWYDEFIAVHRRMVETETVPTPFQLKECNLVRPGWLWRLMHLAYGMDDQVGYDREAFIQKYLDHQKAVIDYFRHREGALLVVDIHDPEFDTKIKDFLAIEEGNLTKDQAAKATATVK
jgi:ABC-type polysaccharide/polyol phosphate transport system ATPase subunit